MANIPGANNILPSVVTDVVTQSRGVSVPGGVRIASIIGEGLKSEVVVSSALGSGKDGFGSTYISSNGSDGRHFLLKSVPVISNRTTLFRNGFPLVGLEEQIDTNAFSHLYDYRIDIATGRIELQTAHLVDQGGSFYSVGGTNVGVGTVENLTLPNTNAPSETWTIKCISVQRDNSNLPIASTAKFIAFGSVSGNLLDSNGNPVVWVANNQVVTNGTLSFSITETVVSLVVVSAFREGDFFTIKTSSGVLNKNDSLTATYIPVGSLNDPEFFDSMDTLVAKHGPVSLTNTLSLGSDLAFENSPPGIMAVQAAPPIPRRSSYNLVDSFDALSLNVNDFKIPLPLNVTPDLNSQIHFFVTDAATGVETQVLPNKFAYYTLDTGGNPSTSTFVFDDVLAPSGHSFFYSVVKDDAVLNFAFDGYLDRTLTTHNTTKFSSSTITTFDSSYIGKKLFVFDGYNKTNNGTFDITSVASGVLSITASGTPPFTDFTNESSITFQVINPVTGAIVASSTGTDGVVTAIGSSATGTFHSATIVFGTLAGFTLGLKLKITGSTSGNAGLYDITAYSGTSSNNLTIAKSFVSEHNLKFEVRDPDIQSEYVVLNHNVVPDGNALRVTLVDSKDAGFFDAGWLEALTSLETQEIDILVPLPRQTMSAIFQNALSHCKAMSNIRNKKERVLFTGAINGLTPDNLTGAKLAAVEDIGILEGIQGDSVAEILAGNTEDLANYSVVDAFGTTFRAVYFFPDQVVAQVGADNVIIDGFYIAAAAAGYLSGVSNVAVPLTNKVLSGFTILRNRMFNQTKMENLAAAGVSILVPVSGGGRCVFGKTTTQSGFPEEEEISIVFIRDRVAKSMRAGFAGYIGLPEDADTVATLTARGIGLLNSFISQGLITDHKDFIAKRDPVDPRQWDISCRVQPTYGINWIFIRLSVGTL